MRKNKVDKIKLLNEENDLEVTKIKLIKLSC